MKGWNGWTGLIIGGAAIGIVWYLWYANPGNIFDRS